MLADERFSKIISILDEQEYISTKELAKRMNVTETTIRRNCEELEQKGLLVRVHGGAKSIKKNSILSHTKECSMDEKIFIHHSEKDKICRKAASFVKDGDCVFLNGGTSIIPILSYLKGKKIKIVTHSSLIISMFEDPDAELFAIGGKFVPEYKMSIGPFTLDALERFNFDHAFLSCAGLDLDRKLVYTAEIDTMAVKKKAMQLSTRSYLLVDSSKYAVKGFCSFINTDDFEAIISDKNPKIDEERILENFILV